jgi:hypothetical protein
MGYNATFSGLFWDISRKPVTNEVETKLDLIGRKGFRNRLKVTNWLVIPIIIGLILTSEYFFAAAIVVFQFVAVIIALRVRQFTTNLGQKGYPPPGSRSC